jgi:hypothetical protein
MLALQFAKCSSNTGRLIGMTFCHAFRSIAALNFQIEGNCSSVLWLNNKLLEQKGFFVLKIAISLSHA